MAESSESDRAVLVRGLANVEGRYMELEPRSIRLGNLVLFFDSDEKLERLHIRVPRGEARLYLVQGAKGH